MGKTVGIDLGTTFSEVAILEGGEPVVITTSEGSRALPSYVAISKTGERLVGQIAKRQAIVNALLNNQRSAFVELFDAATVGEICRQFRHHQPLVYQWLESEILPASRIGFQADPEQAVREGHRPPREAGGQERPGVDVAVPLDSARDQDAGKRLRSGQLEERVVLVIAEQDVVLRLPLLDQVVLEGQGLDDRVGHDDVERIRLVEQGVGLRARAVGPQVAAHAIPEGAGLAHVDRLASRVRKEIDSRLLGQPGDPVLEIPDGHGLGLRVPHGTATASL